MPLAVESSRVPESPDEEFTNGANVRQRRLSGDSGYSPKSNSPTDTVPVNGSVRYAFKHYQSLKTLKR